MKSIHELGKEHGGIELMLRILEAVAKRLEAGQPVPEADLDAGVEFLSVFADKCHHGKEEKHLFPTLAAQAIPGAKDLIKVLLEEHKEGRAFIANLKAGIVGLEAGEAGAPEKIVKAIRDYVGLLTRHIEKENTRLFPLAEAHLSEAEDNRLAEAFEKLEAEEIGPGRHEEFHALLDWLSQDYLK